MICPGALAPGVRYEVITSSYPDGRPKIVKLPLRHPRKRDELLKLFPQKAKIDLKRLRKCVPNTNVVKLTMKVKTWKIYHCVGAEYELKQKYKQYCEDNNLPYTPDDYIRQFEVSDIKSRKEKRYLRLRIKGFTHSEAMERLKTRCPVIKFKRPKYEKDIDLCDAGS